MLYSNSEDHVKGLFSGKTKHAIPVSGVITIPSKQALSIQTPFPCQTVVS